MKEEIRVTIIMGSKSDRDKMLPAAEFLQAMQVPYEIRVASAHRTPALVDKIVNESTCEVFIAGAGMSAALPGDIRSKTDKPIIGVPLSGDSNLLDSLLSMVQMPPGMPVLVVGLNAAKNAAIAACGILALHDSDLAAKLKDYREKAAEKVYADDLEISGMTSNP